MLPAGENFWSVLDRRLHLSYTFEQLCGVFDGSSGQPAQTEDETMSMVALSADSAQYVELRRPNIRLEGQVGVQRHLRLVGELGLSPFASSETIAQELSYCQRDVEIERLTLRYDVATRFLPDVNEINNILKIVHDGELLPSFERALRRRIGEGRSEELTSRHEVTIVTLALLHERLEGSRLNRAIDYLNHGEDRHRASHWDCLREEVIPQPTFAEALGFGIGAVVLGLLSTIPFAGAAMVVFGIYTGCQSVGEVLRNSRNILFSPNLDEEATEAAYRGLGAGVRNTVLSALIFIPALRGMQRAGAYIAAADEAASSVSVASEASRESMLIELLRGVMDIRPRFNAIATRFSRGESILGDLDVLLQEIRFLRALRLRLSGNELSAESEAFVANEIASVMREIEIMLGRGVAVPAEVILPARATVSPSQTPAPGAIISGERTVTALTPAQERPLPPWLIPSGAAGYVVAIMLGALRVLSERANAGVNWRVRMGGNPIDSDLGFIVADTEGGTGFGGGGEQRGIGGGDDITTRSNGGTFVEGKCLSNETGGQGEIVEVGQQRDMGISYFTAEQITSAVEQLDPVAVIREAYTALYDPSAPPIKHVIPSSHSGVFTVLMPYVNEGAGVYLEKTVFVDRRRIPGVTGFIIVYDLKSHTPLAVMDATAITGYRTAAKSLLFAELYFQNQHSTPRTIYIYGSSTQAFNHAILFSQRFPCAFVYVITRSESSNRRVANLLGDRIANSNIIVTHDPASIGRAPDVVITVTSSLQPIITSDTVAPLIIAVGSSSGDVSEIATEVVTNSNLYVDSVISIDGKGEYRIPLDAGIINRQNITELAAVLRNGASHFFGDRPTTLFASKGLIIEDYVVVMRLLGRM